MNTLLALVNDFTPLIAQSSDGLVKVVRDFLGPILLLATGIASMSFLYQRRMTEMITFAIIAVGIFAIFYAPDILKNLAISFSSNNQNWN